MAKTMVIIKRPDEEFGHVTNISTKLENLQKTVGGYIECVSPDPRIVIICDEEGKLIGRPENIRIPGDVIVGTLIVIGVQGDEFCDVQISFDDWKELVRRWRHDD